MINRERTRARRDERAWIDDEHSRSEEDLHLDPAPLSRTRAVRRETVPSTPPSVASQLTELHARLEQLNYFELLDLPETAERQSIRIAFEQRARRFHPDRLRDDDERLRPLAAKVFLHMAEAYHVLDNERTRKQYLASLGLHGRRGAK